MGALGAVILAVLRHPQLRAIDKRVAQAGITALALAAILGALFQPEEGQNMAKFARQILQIALAIGYLGIIWLVWRAVKISELRGLIMPPLRTYATSI